MRFSANEIEAAIDRIDDVDAYGGSNLIEPEGISVAASAAQSIWDGAMAGELTSEDSLCAVLMVGLCIGVALADAEQESRRDFEAALGL